MATEEAISPRKPDLDGSERLTPVCPLCDVVVPPRRSLAAQIGGFPISIGDCPHCGLVMQSPQVTPLESARYMDWRWSSTAEEDRYVTDAEGRLRQGGLRVGLLETLGLTGGRVLDVGAGSGAFCAAAQRRGLAVVGVEPSAAAVARAKAVYGVDLVCGTLEALPPGEKFGCITLWDVIEHLRDPIGVLRQVHERLAPGGAAVIETGNYESAERVVRGDGWSLYLFDHMFYFTPGNLRAVAERAGFRTLTLHAPPAPVRPPAGPAPLRRRLRRAAGRACRAMAHPLSTWRAWRARRLWPDHAHLVNMVAVARA